MTNLLDTATASPVVPADCRYHANPGETDPLRTTREALLAKITAQTESLIPDVTGGSRAHEIALTLAQLAAAYAAIIGSENQ